MWTGLRCAARRVWRRAGLVVLVLVGAVAVMVWRALSWSPSESADAWAYTAWGQALAQVRRPLYDHALTTPKPLGMLLGVAVSPGSPPRAFQLAVAVFLAVLVAALSRGAFREGGVIGVVAAVGAFGFSSLASHSLRFGLIDGVVAALVMVGLATRGRARMACLVLAGLARPEAWPVCGVAGYSETSGSLRRRAVAGVVAAAVAPAIWMLFDLVVAGDPLASLHRAQQVVSVLSPRYHPAPLTRLPGMMWRALSGGVGTSVVAVGAVGVLVQARRGMRRGSFDPVPLAVLVVWVVMIAIETRVARYQGRYAYAAAAPLLLGLAVILGAATPRRWRGSRPLATLAAVTTLAAAALSMPAVSSAGYRILMTTAPAVARALRCGPVGITGATTNSAATAHRPGGVAPVLAALTRHELEDFEPNQAGPHVAAVLALGGGRTPAGWRRTPVGLGTLALSPRCSRGYGSPLE